MLELSAIEIFTRPLEKLGIEYIITGSIASVIYGEPRLTHDVDLVLDLKEGDVQVLIECFPIKEFYCPPIDTIMLEVKREARGHFNLIHHQTGFKADCYPRGVDPLHNWAFENKKIIQLKPDLSLSVAPPEYVILRKLEYYREGKSEKHLRDIAAMLKFSSNQLSIPFIDSQVKNLGLSSEWNRAKKAS